MFDEPILVSFLDILAITLLDQLVHTSANRTLTGGTVSVLGAAIIQIELANYDLNMLKFQDIATSLTASGNWKWSYTYRNGR